MPILRHCYPLNHRPSKVFERKIYYENLDFNLIELWFSKKIDLLKKPIFHLDPGHETRYCRKKYRNKLGKLLYFDIKDYNELRKMVLEYLPEDLYYDRNLYKDIKKCMECNNRKCKDCENIIGQELMFDIDPENIECPNCGTLEDRMKEASTFKFCYICFNSAIEHTIKLYEYLNEIGFKKLEVVYSGRGFHVYVYDNKGYEMNEEERKKLANEVLSQGIAIDEWVTEGEARLARVPYSLNGLVSRICKPIEIKNIRELDFWRSKEFIPEFLFIS
ncbi:MAG: DNA primase small subunit domain-containing protein [Candidatus Methanomethylicaceae archaeon]|nr:DNA primase small subunit domain-containing protein [Candidatus Verstraetearchaeota archaeon]